MLRLVIQWIIKKRRFRVFLEKEIQYSGRNTAFLSQGVIRIIISRSSPTLFYWNIFFLDELVKSKSPTRESKPSFPPEAKTVSREFGEYLNGRVKKAGIADLSRNIQSFIEKVHKRVELLPIEEVSVMVQNFYQALAKRLENHENFVGLTEEERSMICDLTERYIMICCYKQLFCPLTTQDEDKDLEIQDKIR